MMEGKIIYIPQIYSGVYGLGSRDIRPGHFISIVKNMIEKNKKFFVAGVQHKLSIDEEFDPDIRTEGTFCMRGHSVGGYGSVTTNKVIASLVEEIFNLNVQAYPKYGSEKKGLPTTYFLTVSKDPIRTHSELEHVEFVPINDVNAFLSGSPLWGISEGGMVFIQSNRNTPEEVWDDIPEHAQKTIIKKKIKVYYLDTVKIAREISTRSDLQQRMQGIVLLGIFLKVTPLKDEAHFTDDALFDGVRNSLFKYFGKKGEKVVAENLEAVKRGYYEVQEVPQSVKTEPFKQLSIELTIL
jgi:pyruvate-ferredoxin/flavodoxin oxidoreductase